MYIPNIFEIVREFDQKRYCAKRFFRPWAHEIQMFVLRPSVRKIIDSCEGMLRGARVLLSTGTLRLRFSRIQKVIVSK